MTTILYVATCTACGGGNVGIRVSASASALVGMCDECDAVWLDGACTDGPYFPSQPDLPSPVDGASLRRPPAHWADEAEVRAAAGWSAHVKGTTSAI